MQQKYYKQKQTANADSKQFDETVGHIITIYPIFAREQLIERYDRVCAQLNCNICNGIAVKLDNKH